MGHPKGLISLPSMFIESYTRLKMGYLSMPWIQVDKCSESGST